MSGIWESVQGGANRAVEWLDDPSHAKLAGSVVGAVVSTAATGEPMAGVALGGAAGEAIQGVAGSKRPAKSTAADAPAGDALAAPLAVTSVYGWTVIIPRGSVVRFVRTPPGTVAADTYNNVAGGEPVWENSSGRE